MISLQANKYAIQIVFGHVRDYAYFCMFIILPLTMIIIGIAGGTGSGKSTIVKRIQQDLAEKYQITIVPLDSYYKCAPKGKTLTELLEINYDHPDAFDWPLLREHLQQLRDGKPVAQPIYSYQICDRLPNTITAEPTEVIIFEGIMALHDAAIRDLLDLKVYIDAEADERLVRIISRDTSERGRDADFTINRYLRILRPMHKQFIEPMKEHADLIIPKGGENIQAVKMLSAYIKRIIHKSTQHGTSNPKHSQTPEEHGTT